MFGSFTITPRHPWAVLPALLRLLSITYTTTTLFILKSKALSILNDHGEQYRHQCLHAEEVICSLHYFHLKHLTLGRKRDFLDEEELSDIIIKFGDRQVFAHKIILANGSPWFEKALLGDFSVRVLKIHIAGSSNINHRKPTRKSSNFMTTPSLTLAWLCLNISTA